MTKKPTLLDVILESTTLAGGDDNAIYAGHEILDRAMCMEVLDGTVNPAGMYLGTDIYQMTTLVGRVNFAWWWDRWGSRAQVVLTLDNYDCLTRTGLAPDAMSWDPAAPRVFLELTTEMDAADADALIRDYVAFMSASLSNAPVDAEMYAESRDSVIAALWAEELVDPLDFLASLTNEMVEAMGFDRENEGAREFVESALRRVTNLRQLYEHAWGGEYLIEPDDSLAELAEGIDYTEDWIAGAVAGMSAEEPDPVAFFMADADVLDEALRDPVIRAIYETQEMAMNRGV